MIIVACYQDNPPKTRRPYMPVCNLRADETKPVGYEYYDTVKNLAKKNHSYCELSAFKDSLEYFSEEPWLGLSHYRRMFVENSSKKPFDYIDEISYEDKIFLKRKGANLEAWNLRMEHHDVVVARKESMSSLGFANSYEQYCANHPAIYFEYLEEVIHDLFPNLPSFIDYHKQNTGMSFYNMIVAKKSILNDYSDFLFSVLGECESFIGFERTDYQGRWAGFLGERLMDYWITTAGRTLPLSVHEMTVAIGSRKNSKVPNFVRNSRVIRRAAKYLPISR